MRKSTLLLALLIGVVIFSGCSKKLKTTLNINNKTSENVWVEFNDSENWETIASNQGKSYSWQLTKSISGLESRSFDVSYNGYTVFGADTTITLKAGNTKKIDIEADGGCIIIQNDSQSFTITEVYISPSDSTSWGDDVLGGTIAPQGHVSWTVDPGTWDIMVVDDYADSFEVMGEEILLDHTYTYNYTGFKKSQLSSKRNGGKISKKIERNNLGRR